MFMDSSQWPQEFELVNYIEGSGSSTKSREEVKNEKPEKNNNNQVVINCPRCNSSNTKFCYYNNYSLTQPRYMCKTCRRYWTHGGTLRNIPVGGVSRKNKKSSSSILLETPKIPMQEQGQGLNLSFQTTRQDHYDDHGVLNHGVLSSYVPMPVPESSSMLYSNELKPTTLGDSMEGLGNVGGYFGNFNGSVQSGINGRVNLFPFEEVKQHSSIDEDDQNHREQENLCGYWNNGMFGGGTW